MANPTTNYGFVLPTSTDLVTDLPADFDIALQGVDTRLKALQPGTTLGDIAYSSATANTNTRLPIGTSGQVLAVSGGGVPAWTTTADVTPLTTKGDLFTFTTADARLGVGTDGQTLVADSTASTGLKWATPTSSGSITLLSTTALSGATTTISGISQSYTHLIVRIYNTDMSNNATINVGVVDTALNTYSLNGAMPATAVGTGTVEYQGPLLGKTVRAAGTNNINAVITFPFYSTAYGSGNGGPMWTSVGQIYDSAGQSWQFNGGGPSANVSNSTDAIYFGVSAGTWSAGTVKIYGVN